jgi:hypothetical protein
MLITQFASGRDQLPIGAVTFTAAAGGTTTTATNYYYAIQAANPAGANRLSAPVQVAVAAGQQLTISIPASLKLAGESWTDYLISASATGAAGTWFVLTRVPIYSPIGAVIPFPLSVTLSVDDHFALGGVAPNPAALPLNPPPGMRRGVTQNSAAQPLNYYYEYVLGDTTPPNDLTVLPSATGRWLRVGSFSAEVPTSESVGGCDRDLALLAETDVRPISYACDGGDSPSRTYWLNNRGSADITSGQRVVASVLVNDVAQSAQFDGLVLMRFLGYANTTDGTLRTALPDATPMRGVNEWKLFENNKTDFLFEDDLGPDEAYALEIKLNLIPEYFGGLVPPNATVKIYPTIAKQAGSYSEAGRALGDLIYPEYDRALCIPLPGGGVRCLKGSGMVASRSFEAIAPENILSLAPNATTRILINGDGDRFAENPIRPKLATEAVRAIVKQIAGTSAPSNWSAPVTVTNAGLQVQITYPNTIRTNYPDQLIAGLTASPNAPLIDIYVRIGGVIRRFTEGVIPVSGSQTVTLPNWAAGTEIAALPAVPSPDFSLFSPAVTAPTAFGVGDFTGAVEVAYAFVYDGAQVTAISHAPLDGCLPTMALTIAGIEESAKAWAPPVSTTAALRSIPRSARHPYQTRYNAETNDPYRFDPFSLGVDTGAADSRYARPTDTPAATPGRWILDDSSVWFTGLNAPTSAIGEVGSFYLREGGEIYEKSASGWTLLFKLQGSIWHDGAGAPAPALGNSGDYYFDATTGYYWAKITNTWQRESALRVDWYDGTAIPSSAIGKPGDYYYNSASGELFRKLTDNATWDLRANLKGSDGNKFYPVNGAPSAGLGNEGDLAIDRISGDLYEKTNVGWVAIGNLTGPQGPQGPAGGSGGGGGGAPSGNRILVQINGSGGTIAPSEKAIVNTGNNLAIEDSNNNLFPIAVLNQTQIWTKAQKSEVITLYGSYDSVTFGTKYEIDPAASNIFQIEQNENDSSPHTVYLTAGPHDLEGVNMSIAIIPAGNGTMTFDPTKFKFAGGPIAPIDLSGSARMVVSVVGFNSSGPLLCSLSEPFA